MMGKREMGGAAYGIVVVCANDETLTMAISTMLNSDDVSGLFGGKKKKRFWRVDNNDREER
jgi:hypothetical protein